MYGPFLHIKNINSTIPCSPYRIKIFKGESFKGALSSSQFTALFTPSISVSNLPCRFTKGMIFYLLIERFWWPINLKRNSFRETCKVWPPCFIAFISILERACNYWKFTEFLMHNRTSFFSDSSYMMMQATSLWILKFDAFFTLDWSYFDSWESRA